MISKETAAEFLPLFQAILDGKTVEVRGAGRWIPVDCINTEDSITDYRIKREPKTFYGAIFATNNLGLYTFSNPTDRDNQYFIDFKEHKCKPITLLEVIE